MAKAAHSSPEITCFCRHSRGVWGNSADITVEHMADCAVTAEIYWYCAYWFDCEHPVCVRACVWACASWSMLILIESDTCCVTCFVCALWPVVMSYKAAGGHAAASISCLCWLVKLLFVVNVVLLLLVQVRVCSCMPKCLPACYVMTACACVRDVHAHTRLPGWTIRADKQREESWAMLNANMYYRCVSVIS